MLEVRRADAALVALWPLLQIRFSGELLRCVASGHCARNTILIHTQVHSGCYALRALHFIPKI